MWFKNLTIFVFDRQWNSTPAALEESLAKRPLTACPPLGMHSRGWVPPGDTLRLVEAVDSHMLIALGSEEKILPASVIRDRSIEMADEWSRSHGIQPNRKLLLGFKERVISELLPRALTRKRRTIGWIDPSRQRIVVNCGSAARGELLVEHLRETLGGLQVVPLRPTRSPGETMTHWLWNRGLPDAFSLDDEYELSGSDEPGSLIRYRRCAPSTAQLREYLDRGFQVSRLALVWRDRIHLVVDNKLLIKQVRFTQMHEERSDPHRLSNDRQVEAELMLMTEDLGLMIDDLMAAFS